MTTARRLAPLAARLLLLCPLLLCLGSAACEGPPAPADPAPPPPAPAVAPPAAPVAAPGTGRVVWESNRSGAWRLWTSDLRGGGLAQLSADEPGRQHCCPHLAPDGRRLVYLSLPAGRAEYQDERAVGRLELLPTAGGDARTLVDAARTYFEHRAAVWVDARTVHYIAEDGSVRALDVDSGAAHEVLAATGDLAQRWLVDAGGRWAASGRAALAPIAGGRLGPITRLPGCQPYLSHDGTWALWTAGAGGPIDAYDLRTGEATTLLGKNDPRLPPDRGYAYFPMMSRDATLFAFAASDGAHDHHRSDYDVFVADLDPVARRLVGRPWAVAPHPAVDRFPDVWRAPGADPPSVAAAPETEPEWFDRWPARRDGVVWEWIAGGAPTTPLDGPDGPVDPSRPLDLAAGGVVARDSAELVWRRLDARNQMSLEVVVTAHARLTRGLAAIVTAGRDRRRENFLLGQRGDRLVLRLRVGPRGADAYAESDLGPLDAGRRVHLVVAYTPGRTTVYRDGVAAPTRRELIGHFFQWRPFPLAFGDRPGGDAPFAGELHAAAVYDRLVGGEEARRNAALLSAGGQSR